MMDLLGRLKEQGLKQVVGILRTEETTLVHINYTLIVASRDVLCSKIGFKHNRWIDRLHMQVSLDEDDVIDDHVFRDVV